MKKGGTQMQVSGCACFPCGLMEMLVLFLRILFTYHRSRPTDILGGVFPYHWPGTALLLWRMFPYHRT
jgi:hypothetical protein